MATIVDFLTDLSYLLGEDSIPTSGVDSRIGFVNRVCEDIVNRNKWLWNAGVATVNLTNGSGALPIDFRQNGVIFVRNQDGRYYSEVDERYVAQYGKDVFYINGNYASGFTITSNNRTDTSLTIEYAKRAPHFNDVNSTLVFPIPVRIAVGRGALIDVRRSENPFADVAPETAEYEIELRKLARLEKQANSSKRKITSKAHYHVPRT